MVEFVKPERWMIESIAADMRQADIDEVWASSRLHPLNALLRSWEVSDLSAVAMADGEPLVMLGLVKRDVLTGSGVVWMLGANKALKYRRDFFTQTRPVIEQMLSVCPYLYNRVHGKNSVSIRWLKMLGFTIEDPEVFGLGRELFHRFHLERSDYV